MFVSKGSTGPGKQASGEESAWESPFRMDSGNEREDIEAGVLVEWRPEPDVVGRITQGDPHAIDPVTTRMVNQFFDRLEAD